MNIHTKYTVLSHEKPVVYENMKYDIFNKMSLYSNSNYLSSTISIVHNYCLTTVVFNGQVHVRIPITVKTTE